MSSFLYEETQLCSWDTSHRMPFYLSRAYWDAILNHAYSVDPRSSGENFFRLIVFWLWFAPPSLPCESLWRSVSIIFGQNSHCHRPIFRWLNTTSSEFPRKDNLLKKLQFEEATLMTLIGDYQAALRIASNLVFYEKAKHIEQDGYYRNRRRRD